MIDGEHVQNKISAFLSGKIYRSVLFVLVAFLVLAGYIFFFTSPLFFPDQTDVTFSELGQEEEFSTGRSVKLERWDYDDRKRIMEVEVSFKNEVFDANNNYAISARIQKNNKIKKLDTKVVFDSVDMCVIQILNLPKKDTVISLTIEAAVEDTTACRFYSSYTHAYATSIEEPQEEKYYRILRLSRLSESYAQTLSEKEQLQTENNEKIQNIHKTIDELEKDIVYQTHDEAEKTQEQISSYYAEIEELQKQNDVFLKDIDELHEKISTVQKQIAAIGGVLS